MKKVVAVTAFVFLVLVGYFLSQRHSQRSSPEVEILTQSGERVSFQVELAKTPEERAKGLMFRQYLPSNQGMLFIFDQEKRHWFWMKNTLISLDMIFINQEQRVVGIVHQAQPEKTNPLGGWKSKYILEINGGLAEKYGIKEGDKIKFKNLSLN